MAQVSEQQSHAAKSESLMSVAYKMYGVAVGMLEAVRRESITE